jgi:hypothetical protein
MDENKIKSQVDKEKKKHYFFNEKYENLYYYCPIILVGKLANDQNKHWS